MSGTLVSVVSFFVSQEMWGMFERPSALSAFLGFGNSVSFGDYEAVNEV